MRVRQSPAGASFGHAAIGDLEVTPAWILEHAVAHRITRVARVENLALEEREVLRGDCGFREIVGRELRLAAVRAWMAG